MEGRAFLAELSQTALDVFTHAFMPACVSHLFREKGKSFLLSPSSIDQITPRLHCQLLLDLFLMNYFKGIFFRPVEVLIFTLISLLFFCFQILIANGEKTCLKTCLQWSPRNSDELCCITASLLNVCMLSTNNNSTMAAQMSIPQIITDTIFVIRTILQCCLGVTQLTQTLRISW